jgi:hypothetical protein
MRISKRKQVAIGAVLVVFFVAPLVMRAIVQVTSGHGVDGYQNVYGLWISWTSLLIMVGAVILVLSIAAIARAIYHWRVKRGYELPRE